MLPRTTLLTVMMVALIIPVATGQDQPTKAQSDLWAHGSVDGDGVESLWMDFERDDPNSTALSVGPGYCPLPFVADPAGCSVSTLQSEQRPIGLFNHTFNLTMQPSLEPGFRLDPDGAVRFDVSLGARTGECEGTYASWLVADNETIGNVSGVPFAFSEEYETFPVTVPVNASDIDAGSPMWWRIQVECTGSGLFLGVHTDTARTRALLPILAVDVIEPEPEPEEEPEEEPDPEPEEEPQEDPPSVDDGSSDADPEDDDSTDADAHSTHNEQQTADPDPDDGPPWKLGEGDVGAALRDTGIGALLVLLAFGLVWATGPRRP